jgi:cytochrome c5
MKSILKTVIITASFITVLILSACGSKTEKAEEKSETTSGTTQSSTTATYACPMKCEGDKTYDKAGTCPVCNMDLEEVK